MRYECFCGKTYLTVQSIREHYKIKCKSVGSLVNRQYVKLLDSSTEAPDVLDVVSDVGSASESEDDSGS
ncbi:hypothetical protein BGZ51_001933, partial [Haplosporangium sp. Z 767]